MRYDVCESFWCAAFEAGECTPVQDKDGGYGDCIACDKFRTCENCILQTSDNKPHGCEEEGYYLLHWYPEEER
jgi:hypothetical protein